MKFQQVSPQSISYLKSASDGEQEKWFFKLRLKYKINEQNIWFLHKCKELEVTPKHIQLKTNYNSIAAKTAVKVGKRTWIKEELKNLYSNRDNLSLHLKVLHSQLTFKLSNLEFDILYETIHDKICPIVHKKLLIQKRKLDKLISSKIQHDIYNTPNNYKNTKLSFYDRFQNLTNVEFETKEINLLSKGFNFNLKPDINKKHLENLAVEADLAISKHRDNLSHKYLAKNVIENYQIKLKNFNNDSRILKTIKQKSIDNNIIFTKADKGNTVIAIPEIEYVNKVQDFLNNNSFIKLKSDPTTKFQKQVKQTINNSEALFNKSQSFKLTNMNPKPPKLYGLIKLHKENKPIRPVVSYISAPCKNLSKHLITLIREHINFKPKFSIKNSFELVNKISTLEIPNNSKLISFDVTNLFPSIPPKEVINLISLKLDKNKINPIVKTELLNLLEMCLEQNYCQFQYEFYKQREGLSMGNPLSPLLAEIFMDNLEGIISKHPLFKHCIYWFRYVDDVLVCFNGTERQVTSFHNYINTINPNIKFTIETETNKTINFLDLTISRNNNKHEFSIYHKPTQTDTTIHARSFHPITHKLSAYQSMVHRLINIPMSKDNFDLEKNRIFTMALNNGYSIDMVNNILTKKLKSKTLSLIYPIIKTNKSNNYNCITYIGNISEKVGNIIKKSNNESISFKTNNSISKAIKNNKDKTNKKLNSGVYKLTCECKKVYIGQTGRTFEARMKEHERSYKDKKTDSTFSNHCLEFNHQFNTNFEILHTQEKSKKLNLLESIEINKFNKLGIILNDQLDLNNSPLLNLNL